jgi:hypothetical protein
MGEPDTIIKIDGSVICSGIARMGIPVGGAHVRAAEVRVPLIFKRKPAVIATAHAVSGPGVVGAVFGVFSIKVNPINSNSETQVVVQTTNVHAGEPIDGDFDLDYVIIGEVA